MQPYTQPYSISEAVFFAHSHDKEGGHFRRLGLIYLTGKFLLLVVFAILAFLLIDDFAALASLLGNEGTAMSDEETGALVQIQLLSNLQSLIGFLFFPIFLSVFASFYRWTLKDDSSGKWMGLRFGETELQLMIVIIAVYAIIIVAALFSIIPFALVFGSSMAFSAESGSMGGVVAIGILIGLAWLFLLLWMSIRFSLSAALTVRDEEIRIFESFAETKGHFWKLLASFLLLYLVLIVASVAALVLIGIIAAPFIVIGVGMMSGGDNWSAHLGSFSALAFVPALVTFVVFTVIEYWGYAASNGIAAYFLRWKHGEPVERIAEVFGSDAPVSKPVLTP